MEGGVQPANFVGGGLAPQLLALEYLVLTVRWAPASTRHPGHSGGGSYSDRLTSASQPSSCPTPAGVASVKADLASPTHADIEALRAA
jgi:hypothetical protein